MNFIAQSAAQRQAHWRRVGGIAGISVLICSHASAQTNAPPAEKKSPLNRLGNLFKAEESYRPENIFAASAGGKLPVKSLRVAVLPLAAESGVGELPEGCATLTPVVWEQALKTRRFEAVTVDAEKLRAATGRAAWTGGEVLPADFFEFLRREYACDAVLFGELTEFRAYAPLVVGWRFKLVDVQTGKIIWAADEVFDAANTKVAKAAQRFEHPKPHWPLPESGDWAVLNSPRKFGSYSAAALLETLPEH